MAVENMSYSLDEPSDKYDDPDPQREDEQHELDVADAIDAAVREFGLLWAMRAAREADARLAQERANKGLPAVVLTEDDCPI